MIHSSFELSTLLLYDVVTILNLSPINQRTRIEIIIEEFYKATNIM